jgi:hypothetical protein
MDEVYERILNMTNKEAASVIKRIVNHQAIGRANGKTIMIAEWNHALLKAIEVLEKTPD